MKLTVTKTHDLTFSVQYFWSEEGGMGHDTFGDEVSELAKAISLLEIAKAQKPKTDWVIVCEVTTQIQQGKANGGQQ